jgi:hypothetical protein
MTKKFVSPPSFIAVFGSGIRDKHSGCATLFFCPKQILKLINNFYVQTTDMNRSAAEPIQLNDQAAFTVARPTQEKAHEVEAKSCGPTVAESVNQEEMVAVAQPRDSAGVQSFQLKEQATMIQSEDSSVVQPIQQKDQMAVTQLKGSTESKPDEKNQAAATLHPRGSIVVKPIQPMDQQAQIQSSGSVDGQAEPAQGSAGLDPA